MNKRFILAFILSVALCTAAIADDKSNNDNQQWGLGSDINAVIVGVVLTGLGWAVNRFTVWGMKEREAEFEKRLMKEWDLMFDKKIGTIQALSKSETDRKMDTIANNLSLLTKELANLKDTLTDYKASIERKIDRADREIKTIEGNVDNIIPRVNEAFAKMGLYGVNSPPQINIRRGGDSSPSRYGDE
jgi:peptidoglycan hydrolase CwlO-like protein